MSRPVLVDSLSGEPIHDGKKTAGMCSGDLRARHIDGPATPLWQDYASRVEIDWSEAVA